MKRMLVMLLAIIMILSAIPVVGAYAAEAEVAEKAAPEQMMAKEKVLVTTRDITNASIAWVKQATGALIWAPADDTRSDDEIIAQAKAADSSLTGGTDIFGTDIFAVMKGFGTAATPNTNGSKASVNVALKDESIIMTITGNFSHFDFAAKQDQPADPADPTEPAQPAEEGEKGRSPEDGCRV